MQENKQSSHGWGADLFFLKMTWEEAFFLKLVWPSSATTLDSWNAVGDGWTVSQGKGWVEVVVGGYYCFIGCCCSRGTGFCHRLGRNRHPPVIRSTGSRWSRAGATGGPRMRCTFLLRNLWLVCCRPRTSWNTGCRSTWGSTGCRPGRWSVARPAAFYSWCTQNTLYATAHLDKSRHL